MSILQLTLREDSLGQALSSSCALFLDYELFASERKFSLDALVAIETDGDLQLVAKPITGSQMRRSQQSFQRGQRFKKKSIRTMVRL